MKFMKLSAVAALLFSVQAFAQSDSTVPEQFYQPDEGQSAVEFGVNYTDSSATNYEAPIGLRLSASHGLLEGLALRVGTSYTFQDNADGFNNFDLDLLGWTSLGGMTLHYGVLGSVTPDKTPSNQNYSSSHAFTPYVGLSMGGDSCTYGARFNYNAISTTGDVLGNASYTASLFGEMKRDSFLAGLALNYDQVSGSDFDSMRADVYGRIYMSSMTLLPKIMYNYALEDAADDAYGVELAARFVF